MTGRAEGPFFDDVGELIDALTKPLFVWRMAQAMKRTMDNQCTTSELNTQPVRGQYISACTRMERSATEIDRIVNEYAKKGQA